ncbi:MAG: hypothetical protein WC686_05115 [Candidatus Shapirobacteria bacterium]|jgi:hypothetical protein
MRWAKYIVFFGVLGMMFFLPLREAEAARVFCDGSGNPTDTPTADPRIYTALGCIPVRVDQMLYQILPYVFGIAGGISFLLMVYGFILIATSGGDPKAVQGAQETVTSAIKGLLVSIFSIFLLRLIMLQILRIPGVN